MRLLALLGGAYASVAHHPMLACWVLLTPIFALICVMTRWRKAASDERSRSSIVFLTPIRRARARLASILTPAQAALAARRRAFEGKLRNA